MPSTNSGEGIKTISVFDGKERRKTFFFKDRQSLKAKLSIICNADGILKVTFSMICKIWISIFSNHWKCDFQYEGISICSSDEQL